MTLANTVSSILGELFFVTSSWAIWVQIGVFLAANEQHPDIRTLKPGLPACVAAVTNKALGKDPDPRYQSGEQMAKAIRLCLGTLAAKPVTTDATF